MIVAIIYLIISFILENLMSNIFPSTLSNMSLFTTIYSIISIVVIFPYFGNLKKYYILVGVLGILFDIVYTSTFLLNFFIFIIIAIAISYLYHFFSDNIFMINLISIISIALYHIFSFVILSITNYASYSFNILINIILHSIIMTIIYTSISYLVIKLIYNKLNVRQIK